MLIDPFAAKIVIGALLLTQWVMLVKSGTILDGLFPGTVNGGAMVVSSLLAFTPLGGMFPFGAWHLPKWKRMQTIAVWTTRPTLVITIGYLIWLFL